MNCVQLVGRFTKDPEVRYTDGGKSIARFSIAVDRKFKTEGGPSADFISCVSFGKTAEFIEKYFKKGMRIGVTGSIQTGSYTNKDGQKVYTTDVIVDGCEFVESKGSASATETKPTAEDPQGFMSIPDTIDEELPFT